MIALKLLLHIVDIGQRCYSSLNEIEASVDSLKNSIYIGGTNLAFTFVGLYLIDRLGRRTLLIIGSIGYIISLSLVAYAFKAPASPGFLLTFLLLFIASHAIGQGAVIWVFISEIFPNSVRSQGGALGSFTHWIMAAIISWTFPIIVEGSEKGGFYSFVFYSVMMLLNLLFTWRVLPETKGKSLEQIQKDLGIK